MTERTATIMWRSSGLIDRPIFLNVFPLHPSELSVPMSEPLLATRAEIAINSLILRLIEPCAPKNADCDRSEFKQQWR